jgi:hypothetical protein
MVSHPKSEPPPEAFLAASFAESLAQQYVCQGGEASNLFVAFAGLVAGVSEKTATDCLIALDETLGRIAISEKPAPFV